MEILHNKLNKLGLLTWGRFLDFEYILIKCNISDAVLLLLV